MKFHSPNVIPMAVIIMVQDKIKIWTIYLTATPNIISLLAITFTPFTWIIKIFEAGHLKSFQITTEISECLIIKMKNVIVLYTLLTFSSVVVFAGIQDVINVAKYIADILQELRNSCVFIMKSEGQEQGEKYFIFIPCTNGAILKKCSNSTSTNTARYGGSTF